MALGYGIADQFRIEGEGMYQSNSMNDFQSTYSGTGFFGDHIHGSFSSKLKDDRERTAFLLNGYYDFNNSSAFTPFINAGLGGYHIRMKTNGGSSENDLDFAWQAGAGVNYKLDDRISFDLKYRYFGGADAELGDHLYAVGDHQAMVGIRIGF